MQESLWGYVIVLSSHAIGMALLVGIALMINLRLLGFASQVPLQQLRIWFLIALFGFVINLVSGSMLFAADAYFFAASSPFRIKMLLLLASGVLLLIEYFKLRGEDTIGKWLPSISVVAWVGVVISGRLIAYL